MASPLDLAQKIGNTDLGPLKGLVSSKKAAFAFVAFSAFMATAAEATIPALQAVALGAAAVVVAAYLVAQAIVDAVVAHAAATAKPDLQTQTSSGQSGISPIPTA